jgi:hypothetical protein
MEFDKRNSLGSQHFNDIAAYLERIGDTEAAHRFKELGSRSQGISIPFFTHDQWAYTGVQFGFIPNGDLAGDEVAIVSATSMAADTSLEGARLKIALDRFYVHNYPGRGRHEILCEFAGRNQADSGTEEMRFALTTKARDGSVAPMQSLPIFVGVSVGRDGLSFKGRTINIRSDGMDRLVKLLDNPAFKEGLGLLTTAQPALIPFVQLSKGVVSEIEQQGNNKEVFSFGLGLDFSDRATAAKLRLGSYIVLQTDDVSWSWDDVVFRRQNNAIFSRMPGAGPIELNYMIFGVSRASESV